VFSAHEYQIIPEEKRKVLQKQILATLNGNLKYFQEETPIDKDYYSAMRDDTLSLPLNYKFQADIDMVNSLLGNEAQRDFQGESLYSSTIKNQILGQKHIFGNLVLDLHNKFPATDPSFVLQLLLAVRKYSLMFKDPDEHCYIPLLALPCLEFFGVDSCGNNTSYYPFYNFTTDQVSSLTRIISSFMPTAILPKGKLFLLDYCPMT
jgi:hypothetical protein